MEKMTLGRALRYKKRVVETVRNLESDIQSYNCVLEGSTPEVDVRKALEMREAWVNHLVDLKLKIQEATRPIQKLVLELAEIKSTIAFLQRVNVQHGKTYDRWSEEKPQEWFANIRKAERDLRVVDLQNMIDKLQTEIDEFNAKTLIEIDVPSLS